MKPLVVSTPFLIGIFFLFFFIIDLSTLHICAKNISSQVVLIYGLFQTCSLQSFLLAIPANFSPLTASWNPGSYLLSLPSSSPLCFLCTPSPSTPVWKEGPGRRLGSLCSSSQFFLFCECPQCVLLLPLVSHGQIII